MIFQAALRLGIQFFYLIKVGYERGSIVVRAQASHAEGLRFESDSMP